MKSSAAPNYISLTPSNSNISDSVEVLDIPNMRPEQPKRKKTPKKLRPTSGGSPGSGNNPKVKKSRQTNYYYIFKKLKNAFLFLFFYVKPNYKKKVMGVQISIQQNEKFSVKST